jgi:hypothetical protein
MGAYNIKREALSRLYNDIDMLSPAKRSAIYFAS